MKSTPIASCMTLSKCTWALVIHVGAREGCALTRVLRPGKD